MMPKRKPTRPEEPMPAQNQSYDTVLKSLFEGQEQQMAGRDAATRNDHASTG